MLPILSPTDFVAFVNQTMEIAFPGAYVEGEIKNFKISKNRWVYFDLADEYSKIKCFGTIYNLPGPVEEGMVVKILGYPRLHAQFGFSLNIESIELSGEGTIKKAKDLLKQKLEKEGLFALDRKRLLSYPPERIGLITSEESAAYRDFIKVLSARIGGIDIRIADVNVQGVSAVSQVINAVDWFNSSSDLVDVLVIIRGGGDADDLQAFSNEQVVRSVSGSRIPTMVAIGHESDVALSELAADVRASTPSNAAELLVPDRKELVNLLQNRIEGMGSLISEILNDANDNNQDNVDLLHQLIGDLVDKSKLDLDSKQRILKSHDPNSVLKMGYSIIRKNGLILDSVGAVKDGEDIEVELRDGKLIAEVKNHGK